MILMLDEYVKLGWRFLPVEPAIPGNPESGKKPLGKWREKNWTISDLENLQKRLRGRLNIALDCGKSGLVIVDCDSPDAKQYAQSVCKPTGYVVETGGGGLHLYYTSPPGVTIPNRQRIGGHDLDLRGPGGYAVAPDSVHYTGGSYRVVENGEREVFDQTWFPTQATYSTRMLVDGLQYDDQIRYRARRYASKIRAEKGNRDNTAFKVACVFVQKFGLPRDVAIEEIQAWSAYCCSPPLPTSRLIYKVGEAERLKQR
jgi:hypothetical protein